MLQLIKIVQTFNLFILATGILFTIVGIVLFKRRKTNKLAKQKVAEQNQTNPSSDMTKAQEIFRRMNR
jgi:predicted membrane protein